MLVAGPLCAKLRQLRQSGVLGVEHVLRVHGRAPEQGPAGPQEPRAQVLPVGAVHTALSGVPLLHAAPHMARLVHQVRSQHCQPRASGALLSDLREIPGSRQDHALHDQVDRSVLVHAPPPQDRHHEQEVRLRHPAVVLHGRLVLLLRELQRRPDHRRLVVVAAAGHRRHLPRRALLHDQALLLVQLARSALLAQLPPRPQELPPLRHRDHAEHHERQGRVRLRLLSARHHVRLQGARRRPGAHVHGAVRAAHQLVQREGLHVRVVLARLCHLCQPIRSDRLDHALLLLQRALPVRQVSHRAHAARLQSAQVHMQGLRLPLLAARRLPGRAPRGAQ